MNGLLKMNFIIILKNYNKYILKKDKIVIINKI